MTVKELRDKLSKLDDKTKVIVSWEDDATLRLFEIDEISLQKGTARRDESGKPQFVFDSQSLSSKVFISVTPDF